MADTSGPAILGLPSSSKLGVMQMNCALQFTCKQEDTPYLPRRPTTEYGKATGDLLHLQKLAVQHRQSPLPPLNSSKDLIATYPNHFEGIGCFPRTYTIHLHDNTKPVIHAPRKYPIAMHPLVCEKLDEFLKQEITVPVTEATDWASLLAYSWKANEKIWVCLDPKDLNVAIHHDHYHTPTLDEITHKLGSSTCFTKLDGTSSYLCIILDSESSLLMMFNTLWRCYRFVYLPWGLACAQDIFQWMMDQILEHCKGVTGIADDFVIHTHDDDEEHEQHLHTLMQVAREHRLVFNGEKCAVKQPSIKFFGWIYDKDGAHQDPSKVTAIHNMPTAETPSQLQKFLAWSHTYLPLCPLSPPLQYPSMAC